MGLSTRQYVARMNRALYGSKSCFSAEEQAAMRRGYTAAERLAISGRMFGIYAQAISEEHAQKLDALNRRFAAEA